MRTNTLNFIEFLVIRTLTRRFICFWTHILAICDYVGLAIYANAKCAFSLWFIARLFIFIENVLYNPDQISYFEFLATLQGF